MTTEAKRYIDTLGGDARGYAIAVWRHLTEGSIDPAITIPRMEALAIQTELRIIFAKYN